MVILPNHLESQQNIKIYASVFVEIDKLILKIIQKHKDPRFPVV